MAQEAMIEEILRIEKPSCLEAYDKKDRHLDLVWIADGHLGFEYKESPLTLDVAYLRLEVAGLEYPLTMELDLAYDRDEKDREIEASGRDPLKDEGGSPLTVNRYRITGSGEFTLERLIRLIPTDNNLALRLDDVLTWHGLARWSRKKAQTEKGWWKIWKPRITIGRNVFFILLVFIGLISWGLFNGSHDAVVAGDVIHVELQTSADIPLTGEENELVGKLVKKGQVLARVDVTKQPEEINRLKLENAEADSRRKGIQGEIQSLDVIIKSQSSNTTLANTVLTREEDLAKLGFLAKTAVENTIVHRNEQEAKLKGLQQQREGLIVEDRLAQAKIIANTSRILDLTKQLSRVESRLSPCTCYVLSATSSSGRIVFTLIDPKKQGYIEVALLKNQASSLIPGEQFSFIFNNETQKGKFSQISTNKKTRIGIPDALWDNPKYTIVQIQPDYPILLEENIKVLGQQVHVLWLNGWFRNLWNTIQMNSQRFIG